MASADADRLDAEADKTGLPEGDIDDASAPSRVDARLPEVEKRKRLKKMKWVQDRVKALSIVRAGGRR